MAFNPNATVLEDAIVRLNADSMLDEHRFRRQRYGALSAHADQVNMLVPAQAIEQAKASARHTVKIPLLQRTATPVITTRSCTIVCNDKGSEFFTLTWNTVGFTVCATPSIHEDNYISKSEFVQSQIADGLDAVYQNLEAQCVTNLENNKATTVDAGSTGVYAFSGTAYQVPQTAKDDFYLEVPSVLEYNDVMPRYTNVATINEKILRRTILEFGAQNERNRATELSNADWMFYNSKNITNAGGVQSTHYMFKEGSVGILNWVDPDARNRERIHESKFWDTFTDPTFGFDWGVYYNADCADKSAELAGLERTKTELWEFTADFATIAAVPNNLVAGDNPIYKFEILT